MFWGILLLLFCVTLNADFPSFYRLNGSITEEQAQNLFESLSDPRISIYTKLKKAEDQKLLHPLFDYILEDHANQHHNLSNDIISDLKNSSYEEWNQFSSSQFISQDGYEQFKGFIKPLVDQYLDLGIKVDEKKLKKEFGLVAYVNEDVDTKKYPLNDALEEEEKSAIKKVITDKSRAKPYLVHDFAQDFPAIWDKLLKTTLNKLEKDKLSTKSLNKVLLNLYEDGRGDGAHFKLFPYLAQASNFDKDTRKLFDALNPVTAKHLNLFLCLTSLVNSKITVEKSFVDKKIVAGVEKVVQNALKQAFDKLEALKNDTTDLKKVLKSDDVTLFHKFYNISKALPEENVLQEGTKDLEKSGLDRQALRAFETFVAMYIAPFGKPSYFINRGLSEEDGDLLLGELVSRLTPVQYEQVKALVPGAKKALTEFVKKLN